MDTTSPDSQNKPRFLIKANADAIRRNLNRKRVDYPIWVIINGANHEQMRLVFGIKGADFQSQVNVDQPLPDGYGHGIAYFLTSNDVDVQLHADGEYRSFASLLEEGSVKWALWQEEYHRLGLDGCA